MARFVYGMSYRGHIGKSELRDLSWLTVPDRVRYFKLLHLFRVRNGSAPANIGTDFQKISMAHSHNTRGSTSDYRISHTMSLSQCTFSFTAIRSWNALPGPLKKIESLQVFKKRIKEFLFSAYDG